VQNVFLRFGILNSLNFLLGNRNNYLGRMPKHFESSDLDLELVPWHKQLEAEVGYDVATLHSRWNHTTVRYTNK
jgi:hypothetical protein